MAATVGATVSFLSVFPDRHANLGPFIGSSGLVFFFGRHTTNTGQVLPASSSSPMVSFGDETLKTMSSGTTTAIQAMACYQVGDVVHIVTQISTGACYYNNFNLTTGAWGLSTSETAVAAASFAPTSAYTFVSLVVRSNGEVVVAYCAGLTAMSSGFNMVRLIRRTGVATWVNISGGAGGTNIDNGGSNNWSGGLATLGASDRVHFWIVNNTTAAYYQRTLTAANALQTFPASFASTGFAGPHSLGPGYASYASGGNTIIAIPYYGTNALAAKQSVARITSGDAPTPTTEAASNVTEFNSQSQEIHTLAGDGSTLHYLYSDDLAGATPQDLMHMDDGGAATWTARTNELTGTINRLTSNVYTRSGSTQLAMVIDDGGTIKYAEITLAAAVTTSFPFQIETPYRILSRR